MVKSTKSLSCTAATLVGLVAQLAILVIILVFGSDKPPTLLIANNYGKNLVLKGNSKTFQIPSNSVVEVSWPSSNQTFVFEVDNTVLVYKWIPVNEPYYQYRQYYVQIEPDGKLYALSSRVNYPISVMPPQPDGYPLEPFQEKNP